MTIEPRTRRHLREALEEERATSATRLKEIARLKSVRDNLHDDIRRAEDKLYDLGYVLHGLDGGREWMHRSGKKVQIFPQDELEQREENTINKARRETLEKVIEALELTEYHRSIARFENGRASGYTSSVDRFWSDIQTALEVREEKKLTEERKRTEEKVAGLAQRPHGTLLHGLDLADGLASVLVKMPDPPFSADDARNIAKVGDELGVKKKPAKKKSSTKGDRK